MKSILQQIYNGEFCPEDRAAPMSAEYHKSQNAYNKRCDELIDKCKAFDPEIENELSDIFDELWYMCTLEKEDMFCCGFNLAVKILMESRYFI